jgi:4-amino-4-deoxy-L-arabinose transferase-like glycosyltransferase
VYYVHIETLDAPMLFWLSSALYCYLRALQTLELRYYLWLAVLAAVSTAT